MEKNYCSLSKNDKIEEREERQKEREAKNFELEKMKERLRSTTDRLRAMKLIQPNAVEFVARLPELPKFVDGKDNSDRYLQRFERFARSKWKQDDWPVLLSALLTSRPLDVYCRLSETATTDYDQLKEALLKRYDFT